MPELALPEWDDRAVAAAAIDLLGEKAICARARRGTR